MAMTRWKPAMQQAADAGSDTKSALQRVLDELNVLEASLQTTPERASVRAAQRLNRSAATLATSVLPDSAVEHYRGSFENKAMFTPLIVSALTLAVSAHGAADKRAVAHGVRDLTYVLAALTGVAGSGFHVYNVMKKPGGMSWQNLFYGAPLGAPRNVVVAGYAIETPRLLLNSSSARFPDGLANSSGLVGKNLMAQSNQAVWGIMDQEVRWYKGPPSLAITEHWNYEDAGKDFHGGYAYMSQGPLPQLWANTQMSAHGLWGDRLISEMEKYNHQVGLKIVGEMLPQERNRVTLTDEKDQYGLPVPRVTYAWGDNDKRLINHSIKFMTEALRVVDAREIWAQDDDTCHLNGTARMGDDPRSSVVNADCRSWDIRNLWICDGSVFPTVGGVNPSLTIQAIACRTGDRIKAMARRGEL
jgi:hypothetical protein